MINQMEDPVHTLLISNMISKGPNLLKRIFSDALNGLYPFSASECST